MNAIVAASSALFDVLLAPFGERDAWLDLALWSVLSGIGALLVYRALSAQRALARVKNAIKVHLLEIRLFDDDVVRVLRATGRILVFNVAYVGLNLVPTAVLALPMTLVMVQLVAHHAYLPLTEGTTFLVEAKLRPDASGQVLGVVLDAPPGLDVMAPPVRSPGSGEVVWRLDARAAGDHVLRLRLGDAIVEKGVAVGGEPRKIPVRRDAGLEHVLYPGEAALPAGQPFESIAIRYPARTLGGPVVGEVGIVTVFVLGSLAAAWGLKGRFGVTL